MPAYYNEFNSEAAHMLRQLIADGHCAPGDVDERSITEVHPDDLKGYTQCHFFAGIGGWSIGLRLAGWPDHRPVWTGSAPCQPFSAAGRQKGKDDERHLFPTWLSLIRECRPATIFGEQVATAVAHGWLDDVYAGLEAEGYAVGAAVLPACSIGAPHRRDRLWFVANASGQRPHACPHAGICGGQEGAGARDGQPQRCGGSCPMGNPTQLRVQGSLPQGDAQRWEAAQRHSNVSGGEVWAGADWAQCADGKYRLTSPSVPMLAHGFQHRKPILHALGNAIVPQVAAAFITASIPVDPLKPTV